MPRDKKPDPKQKIGEKVPEDPKIKPKKDSENTKSKEACNSQATLLNDGKRVWNAAPQKIRDCTSLGIVKKEIKKFVATLPFCFRFRLLPGTGSPAVGPAPLGYRY